MNSVINLLKHDKGKTKEKLEAIYMVETKRKKTNVNKWYHKPNVRDNKNKKKDFFLKFKTDENSSLYILNNSHHTAKLNSKHAFLALPTAKTLLEHYGAL